MDSPSLLSENILIELGMINADSSDALLSEYNDTFQG